MEIKSNKNKNLCIFCTCLAFIFIFSTIALSISNGIQLVFSQGYIPPPLISPSQNSIQSSSQPMQQQPDQSMQLQQQPQNTPLITTNNLNTLGPLGTEAKDRLNDKIGSCPTNDLTGKWIANDGGVYYIKQNGIWIKWFGSTLFNDDAINSNKGFSYSNTANGPIRFNGTNVILSWSDINISDNHLAGSIVLSVDPSGSKLTKISEKGGFGPSEWTRKC